MTPTPVRSRTRNPVACKRCRQSKTKCNAARPCRNCQKRGVACTFPPMDASSGFSALIPQVQELRTTDQLAASGRYHPTISGKFSQVNNSFILPGPGLVQNLVQVFFKKHHETELCSFLHKPSLDIPALHGRSPLLVASIFSIAALYIDSGSVAGFGFSTSSALSDHYARIAKSYAHSLCDEPSIYTIQAYLILAVRELVTWEYVKAYMYAGTALRMAQAMDLSVESICIQLPCPENFFTFDEVYSGLTIEYLSLQTHQVSQIGIMPFFIAMVRLWGDMALLHVSGGRRRSKHGPHSPESGFYQCEKAIENFATNLPPSLNWSSQNYKLHQVTGHSQAYVNLNFLLHHSRCVMHQEYLPQLDSQYSLDTEVEYTTIYDAAGVSFDFIDSPIIKPCVRSVNAITEMAIALHGGSEEDKELLQSNFAANAILTAAAVHLWILYTQTCDECPKHEALAKAERLRQIIKSWQTRWRVATAWAETLEMLYKLYVYSYGKIVESDLDCWDMGPDDIGESLEATEVIDESSGHPRTSDADSMVYPSSVCHRLHDKVRNILVNPLLPTHVKKRNLRVYCRTLWQHMWILGPTESYDDDFLSLETLMGEPGSGLLDTPYLGLSED